MSNYRKPLSCNHAYIDAANLDRGTARLGWRVDYRKFYVWLKEKHHIKRAYIFIGYISKYDNLYTKMREAGFLVRFKDVTDNGLGQIKGNCDADLVLRTTRDVYESVFDQAVIVSSDGDFSGLVSFLLEEKKMDCIVSPNAECSFFLRRQNSPITYLNDVKSLIAIQ